MWHAFWGFWWLCLQGCQHLPSRSRNAPMCLRNLPKNICCMGTLIEAEILTSPLPHVFPQLGLDYGHTQHSAHGCVNTSQVVYKYVYVSEELLKNLVHGALIEAEILTSPLCHVFAQYVPVLGTGTLSAGVSPPVKWSRNVSMCLRNFQKCIWYMGP